MHDEGDAYGRTEASDPWNEDKRKAYVKRMIKASKDLPAQFKRPDYKANMSSSVSEAPVTEEAKEASVPQEKKKEKYEL